MVIEEEDQVPLIPSESIKPPDHQDIEPPTLRVSHEVIERRATFLGSGNTLIDILASDGPLPRLAIPPQLRELVLAVLIESAHLA